MGHWNIPIEGCIVDRVMFTVVVLRLDASEYPLRLRPSWSMLTSVTTKGQNEVTSVVALYDHVIVADEQVVRLGTVEKTISSAGMAVVIYARWRNRLACGVSER